MPILIALSVLFGILFFATESMLAAMASMLSIIAAVVYGVSSARDPEATKKEAAALEEWKRRKTEEAQFEWINLVQQAEGIIDIHLDTLRRKARESIDDYGTLDQTKIEREVNYFVSTAVVPRIDFTKIDAIENELNTYRCGIFEGARPLECLRRYASDSASRRLQGVNRAESSANGYAAGIDFEHRCAERLENQGWRVVMTSAGQDQGVDLIAEKGILRAAVQCKAYAVPVGNSAVQQVVAGRAHYSAEYAAVISQSGFTKSARILALSNDVALVAFEDLDRLEALLAESRGNS